MLITITLIGCMIQDEEASTKEKINKVNKALSMNLSLEQGVAAGQVFLKDDIATAKIIAEHDIEESKIREIAEKYVEILKENYQNKNISVQGMQNNKNIVDLFIEQ
jgi:hypothetical protein